MIEPIILYSVKCDRCGKLLFDYYNNFTFDNIQEAEKEACKQNWYEFFNKYYCTNCYANGENGTVIKGPIPDYVKKLQLIINTISSFPCILKEYDDYFAICGYTKYGKELDLCDNLFIKSFAGDKLIGIEFTEICSSKAEFIIKLKKE